MSVDSVADLFAVTEFGQALIRQGVEQGREQEREQFLVALLQDRFGSQPGIAAVAERLSGWPSDASVHAITTAADLDELLSAQPPA